MKRNKSIILSLIIIIVLMTGAAVYKVWLYNPVIAKVGNFEITKQDADQRDQVVRSNYPESEKGLGLEQLIRGATSAEILKSHGFDVSDKLVREDQIRIEQNTRARANLEKIKAIFKGDMDAYRRVFIFPDLADRVLYSYFTESQVMQAESKNRAQKIIPEAQAAKNLKEFAAVLLQVLGNQLKDSYQVFLMSLRSSGRKLH